MVLTRRAGLLAALTVVAVVIAGIDRDELVHRAEVIDEELPVEVIELVLEGPPEQSRAGNLDLLAVPVLGDDPDLLSPRDIGVVARQ